MELFIFMPNAFGKLFLVSKQAQSNSGQLWLKDNKVFNSTAQLQLHHRYKTSFPFFFSFFSFFFAAPSVGISCPGQPLQVEESCFFSSFCFCLAFGEDYSGVYFLIMIWPSCEPGRVSLLAIGFCGESLSHSHELLPRPKQQRGCDTTYTSDTLI